MASEEQSESKSELGEPPTPSEHELPEMPTAEDVMILVCDNCGDIVKPGYKQTLDKMKNQLCLKCNRGSLKLEETDLVRRQNAEERIQKLNARWAKRLENAVRQERKRILERIEKHVLIPIEQEGRPETRNDAGNLLRHKLQELQGEHENQDHEAGGN